MTEKEFAQKLCNKLQKDFPGFDIECGKQLLYKFTINLDGNITPDDYKNPKRGRNAFETDILISKKNAPIVVIETKIGDFTTHDVLTYSSKALKHKEIYPHLRYGFIIGNTSRKTIGKRLFVHNYGFDFAIVYSENKHKELKNILKEQIDAALNLAKIYSGKKKVRYFSERLRIK